MRRWLPALLIALGCSQEPKVQFLDLLPAIPSSARSLVIAVVDLKDDSVERATAVQAPFNSPITFDSTDRMLELTVVAYDSELSELDLEPGTLTFVESGASRPLPARGSIQTTVISDGTPSAWNAVEVLPRRPYRETTIARLTLLRSGGPLFGYDRVRALLAARDDGAVLVFAGGYRELPTVHRATIDGVQRLDANIPDWTATIRCRLRVDRLRRALPLQRARRCLGAAVGG